MTSVRQACHEDAWAIADLHVRTWRAAYRGLIPDDYLDSLSIEGRRQGWVETLRGDTTTVLVAEGSGLLEGFVAFGASREGDTGGRVGEVYALYVQPGAWRSGAGSALHDAAIQALAKADLIPAVVGTRQQRAGPLVLRPPRLASRRRRQTRPQTWRHPPRGPVPPGRHRPPR